MQKLLADDWQLLKSKNNVTETIILVHLIGELEGTL